jgi:hypothetical protein
MRIATPKLRAKSKACFCTKLWRDHGNSSPKQNLANSEFGQLPSAARGAYDETDYMNVRSCTEVHSMSKPKLAADERGFGGLAQIGGMTRRGSWER